MPPSPRQPEHGPSRATRLVAAAALALASVGTLAISAGRAPADVPAPSIAPSPLDLNSASAAELELLPRIGPKLAARIVEDRATRGPFASVDALDRVKGIGPRTVAAIRRHATAD